MVSVSRLLNGPSAGAYGISGLWKQLNFGAPFWHLGWFVYGGNRLVIFIGLVFRAAGVRSF